MNTEKRNAIVVEYLPLTIKIAGQLKKRLPKNVLIDDLVNDGIFGLMNAIKRFDKKRGVPFKSFAYLRIRGAMIDRLRDYSWVPRLSIGRIGKLREAVRSLRQNLQREPNVPEIARRMRMTQAKVESIRMEELRTHIPDDQMMMKEGGDELTDVSHDRRAHDPWETACYKDQVQKLMNRLPLRDRQIATLYFVNDFTLKKIGEIIGLSESRTCQLVHRIKSRLGKLKSLSA